MSAARLVSSRFGDFLPSTQHFEPGEGVDSRTGRRRTSRVRRLHREAVESVFAVKAMEGYGNHSKWSMEPENAAKLEALKESQTMDITRRWPESGALQPRAALRKLLRTSVSSGTTAGTLESYGQLQVSLSSDQAVPCALQGQECE